MLFLALNSLLYVTMIWETLVSHTWVDKKNLKVKYNMIKHVNEV